MEENDVARLYETSRRLVDSVEMSFQRYLAQVINWENRLVCIQGAKGVGKTTMVLQHIKQAFGADDPKALFVSLDNIWFAAHQLLDLADWHWKHGGTHLFLDEVHHLPNWQTIIKNIYDSYPALNIVYTGSSLLRLETGGADLSRRRVAYDLAGLSFREFLEFEGVLHRPAVTFEDVLGNHRQLAAAVCSEIRVLECFTKYQNYGYYPFYKEGVREFHQRLRDVVNQVLERDYPAVEEVTVATIIKAKKMLQILAESVPQTPKMSRLYAELETDRNHGLKILKALARAGLLGLLFCEKASLKDMSRPDKILLDNTCLMYALSPTVESGCRRETFLRNQLSVAHELTYPPAGDFLVDGKFLFEVGGEGKGFGQIKDIADSYVVNDDTEVGIGNKIPLWLFGFLY